jgi:hypothetical protein
MICSEAVTLNDQLSAAVPLYAGVIILAKFQFN